MKRSTQIIVMLLLSFLFIFMIGSPSAKCEIKRSNAGDDYTMHRETDVLKLLSVLESRIGDQKLLEEAKKKLFALRESQFLLVTSLSEQMTKQGNKPGDDLAFLLITALIILS